VRREFQQREIAEKPAEDRTGRIIDLLTGVAQNISGLTVLRKIAGEPQELHNPLKTVLGDCFVQQRSQVITGQTTQSAAWAIVVGAARVVQ
jgi:hypothetical protein